MATFLASGLAAKLFIDAGGIVHSGIHIDSHSKREKIWLNDPDKIRIEFFIYE